MILDANPRAEKHGIGRAGSVLGKSGASLLNASIALEREHIGHELTLGQVIMAQRSF